MDATQPITFFFINKNSNFAKNQLAGRVSIHCIHNANKLCVTKIQEQEEEFFITSYEATMMSHHFG
jgi:hypothetical protein